MTTLTEADRKQVAEIALQIGSELMPDNKMWVNRFTVESQTSSAVYTVAQRRTDHVWGCSCRGWINHKKCKHLTDILHRLSEVAERAGLEAAVLQMVMSARTAYLDLDGEHTVTHVKAAGRSQLDL